MRLSKIKLAGFKSFVDPTSITFPSSLVGVVGPNGCGKSNVIDAVRWVMGESSASRLRGDSITDVIFNGSSSRKPVGAASVELLFDNTDTTLEGQYAQYDDQYIHTRPKLRPKADSGVPEAHGYKEMPRTNFARRLGKKGTALRRRFAMACPGANTS